MVLRHFEEEMRTTQRTLRKLRRYFTSELNSTKVRSVHDWIDNGGICFRRKEKIKERAGAFDDKFKRPHDPRMSGSSVCETERCSLFRPTHDRTNIGASVEYMCQDAERR